MRIKKKLLFVLMIPLVLSANGFAVVEKALKGVSKIQSGLNDSLEEQCGKFESQKHTRRKQNATRFRDYLSYSKKTKVDF